MTKRCRSYHGYSFAETLVGTCFFLKLLDETAQDLGYESLKEEQVEGRVYDRYYHDFF